MSYCLDVSSKSTNALDELKRHIKQWESKFLLENGRKPNKKDIDDAQDNIKDIYGQYWKARKVVDQSSVTDSSSPGNNAWSTALNKSNSGKQKKISAGHGGLEYFSEKLKSGASVIGPIVKKHCSRHNLWRSGVDKSNILLTNEEVKAKSNQNSAPVSDEKSCIEENIQKNVDVQRLVNFSLKKRVSIAMPHNSLGLKKINVLSSSLIDVNSRNANIQMNVNPSWLESCAVINDCKRFQVPGVVRSADAFDGEVSELALTNTESKRAINGGISVSVKTVIREDSLELKDHSNFGHSGGRSTSLFGGLDLRTSPVVQVHLKSLDGGRIKVADLSANSKHSDETCITETTSVSQSENVVPIAAGISKIHMTEENPSENEVSFSMEKLSMKRKFSDTTSHEEIISEEHKSDGMKHTAKKSFKKSSGSVSDNYVRINLKKKIFVRGHRKINVRRMKFQKWKEYKKRARSSPAEASACFRCGKSGHWARSCSASQGQRSSASVKEKEPTTDCTNSDNEDEPTVMSDQDFPVSQTVILPLYDATSDGKIQDTRKEVLKGLKKMGYSEFRPGQEKAIMRILSGMSTLLVSSTGSGKSLCYQLPAYLYAQKYNCITLVISPLVSLMEDQVTGLPSCLNAVCLHSGMSDTQKEATATAIMRGAAQILLVSPEAVISGKLTGSILFSKLPPIAFVCIDEAHCLSEWSHNFRPSYLQLLKVLRDKMNVKCVLGLTATATCSIVKNIANHLKLKEADESIIGETSVPPNLLLTVSRDKDKDWALIELLKEERFRDCNSILVYCNRREETERLAMLIRTSLQRETSELSYETDKKKSQRTKKDKQLLFSAEAYHAGLKPHKRKSIQKNFMTGKLHVVVATIAFGMGLDKSDVRAVIHYNMPKSFENYVQEIGRAGRDGLLAQCHVFLDCEGKDLWELRRHIYSNSVDRRTIRKLLQKVFFPCKCYEKKKAQSQTAMLSTDPDIQLVHQNTQTCVKHERNLPIAETVQELDLKEESITTLLCYLALHSNKWVEILSPTYATCSVRCYGGPQQMNSLVHKCPIIAAAVTLDEQNQKQWNGGNEYQFHIADVASHMSWESSAMKKSLKQLEWSQTNGKNQKTGVIIEFSDLAFHILACGDLESDELDAVLDFLCDRTKTQEEQELQQLHCVFSTFLSYSFSNYWSCVGAVSEQRSEALKQKIKQYFDEGVPDEQLCKNPVLESSEKVSIPEIRQHVREFVSIHHDHSFTGRAVARIFQGISSPCYPSEVWGRVRKFWRSYLNIDFNLLLKIANEEILKLR